MKVGIGFAFLVLLCGAAATAQEKTYAPLPDKVIAAKTVFLVNDSGTTKLGDALYRQVKDWNRWQVVTVFSGILAVLVAFRTYANIQVHATPGEEARPLAGDDLIAQPLGSVNNAITIRRPPRDVWPCLAQMGSGRAGWYAYDFIDNRGHRSAETILPEYQNIGMGSVLPALLGARDVFLVAQCDPQRSLVLSWRLPGGKYQTTWAFEFTASRAHPPGH